MDLPIIHRALAEVIPDDQLRLVPTLPPGKSLGEVLRWAELGMRVAATVAAVKETPLDGQGDAPPLKDFPGVAGQLYTLAIHYLRTR